MSEVQIGMQTVRFTYTNHAGKTEERIVTPRRFWFGTAPPYYANPEWLMQGYCHARQAPRTFAVTKIEDWKPHEMTPPEPQQSPALEPLTVWDRLYDLAHDAMAAGDGSPRTIPIGPRQAEWIIEAIRQKEMLVDALVKHRDPRKDGKLNERELDAILDATRKPAS